MGTGIVVGADLGQSADYTAVVTLSTYRPDPITPRERPEVRHRIRWIERVPLGQPYTQIVERVAVVAEAAQGWGHAVIVLDATGVGRAVTDMLRRRTAVPLRAVTFTSGEHETQSEYNALRVPKQDLVTALEVVLQSRRLECVPDCPLQAELAAELSAFDFSISDRGHALGLAVWWGERPDPLDAWMEAQRRLLARS